MEKLEEVLRQDEGEVLEVYLDTKGNPTAGVGHHFYVGSKISRVVSDLLLKQDITIVVSEYNKIPRNLTKHLNTARARVIVCMIFNMGLKSVMAFRNMWSAIERDDWPGAKAAMLDSKWHKDVGARAERLAEIMLTGVWPGGEK